MSYEKSSSPNTQPGSELDSKPKRLIELEDSMTLRVLSGVLGGPKDAGNFVDNVDFFRSKYDFLLSDDAEGFDKDFIDSEVTNLELYRSQIYRYLEEIHEAGAMPSASRVMNALGVDFVDGGVVCQEAAPDEARKSILLSESLNIEYPDNESYIPSNDAGYSDTKSQVYNSPIKRKLFSINPDETLEEAKARHDARFAHVQSEDHSQPAPEPLAGVIYPSQFIQG